MFTHSLLFSTFCIGICILIGVKNRLYSNYIQKGRELEFAKHLDIDLEDLDNYPRSALEMVLEQRKEDKYLEVKEEKI